VSHQELFANIPSLPLVLLIVFFQSSLTARFVATGEDGNIDRFKNWMLCGFWKPPFRHHGAIKITQNCVCFINPCINSFVPTSVTRDYHPKVLERLQLLQCISAHLQNTLPWVSWETQYLNLFSDDFRSCLVARSRNRSNACWRPCFEDPRIQYQFVRKKTTVHLAVPKSDTLVDTSVTAYSIHIDQGSSNFLGEGHISYCTTIRGLDILRNVIFSGYVTFQINTFFVNALFFHYWQNAFCGWVKRLLRSDFVPRAVVRKTLI